MAARMLSNPFFKAKEAIPVVAVCILGVSAGVYTSAIQMTYHNDVIINKSKPMQFENTPHHNRFWSKEKTASWYEKHGVPMQGKQLTTGTRPIPLHE